MKEMTRWLASGQGFPPEECAYAMVDYYATRLNVDYLVAVASVAIWMCGYEGLRDFPGPYMDAVRAELKIMLDAAQELEG